MQVSISEELLVTELATRRPIVLAKPFDNTTVDHRSAAINDAAHTALGGSQAPRPRGSQKKPASTSPAPAPHPGTPCPRAGHADNHPAVDANPGADTPGMRPRERARRNLV